MPQAISCIDHLSTCCLSSETMFIALCLILFLNIITGGQGQNENPCEPNPCGKNTRCLTQQNSGRSVISCKCLPGQFFELELMKMLKEMIKIRKYVSTIHHSKVVTI